MSSAYINAMARAIFKKINREGNIKIPIDVKIDSVSLDSRVAKEQSIRGFLYRIITGEEVEFKNNTIYLKNDQECLYYKYYIKEEEMTLITLCI